MRRRTLLVGVSTATTLLAGCLGNGSGNLSDPAADGSASEGNCITSSGVSEGEFEQCPHRIVRVTDLPSRAEGEATSALNDDQLDADGSLVLPDVIAIGETFLFDQGAYFAIDLTDREEEVELCLTERQPIFQNDVVLENHTKEPTTIELRIEHEVTDSVLIESSIELDEDDEVVLNDERDFPYGTYHAEVGGDELSEGGAWEITWELNWAHETGSAYPVQLDDHGLFVDPESRNSMFGPCTWDDDGDVDTGTY